MRKTCISTRLPSAKEFNSMYQKLGTNCLAFALGRTTDSPTLYDLLTIDEINLLKNGKTIPKKDICEAFIAKAKQFNLNVRQITDMSEADGKVLFILFGWYTDFIQQIGNYDYFFHVIRRNELGVYEHKADWYEKAKVVTNKELLTWLKLNIERYYFVLD
jgi:hypothetical protein